MSTDTLPAPLAVWDVRDENGCYQRNIEDRSRCAEMIDWVQQHMAPHARHAYRAEFYLIDAPFAVLWMYERDENGRVRIDPATMKPALLAEPVTVTLDSLPPERLRR